MLLNPQAFGFVCVADAGDVERLQGAGGGDGGGESVVQEGTVLGYTWLYRRTPTPSSDLFIGSQTRHKGWLHSLEHALRKAENLYENYISLNAAVSRENMVLFYDMATSHDPWARLESVPHWHLAALAVAPAWQGRGVGRKLVGWGLEMAFAEGARIQKSTQAVVDDAADEVVDDAAGEVEREQIGAQVMTLNASPSGKWLYEKMGFRVLRGDDGEVEFLRLPIEAPNYGMIYDPRREWTEQTEEGDATWKRSMSGAKEAGMGELVSDGGEGGEGGKEILDEGIAITQ